MEGRASRNRIAAIAMKIAPRHFRMRERGEVSLWGSDESGDEEGSGGSWRATIVALIGDQWRRLLRDLRRLLTSLPELGDLISLTPIVHRSPETIVKPELY